MMKRESVFQVRVECYAGYRGEETPRRFYVEQKRIEVAEVVDRWLDPEHRYFKLLSEGGDLFILRHEVSTDSWKLTFFESGSFSSK